MVLKPAAQNILSQHMASKAHFTYPSTTLNTLIILVLSSNVRFESNLLKKFSINSGYLLGLPPNLIKGIGGKLGDSNSCWNAKLGGRWSEIWNA